MAREHTMLSLDLGSTLGWAFVKADEIRKSGTIQLTRKDSHPGDRFRRFEEWLFNWRGVKEICYEDVLRFASAGAAKSYCGYLSILQVFCLNHGIRLLCIKPTAVKKGFAGKGNADKKEMCEVAHKLGWRNGYKGTDIDHDECDAIAVAWVILSRKGLSPVIGAREAEKVESGA
jgi:Holliday junction resolvasome RuvABC endonuclease subunit